MNFVHVRIGRLLACVCLAALGIEASSVQAEQFVLFDATFTFTKADADSSKPSPSHYYVRDKLMNADRPKDWTSPVDYRNGTAHVRLEVLEKPAGGEATTWSVCYIPNKGRDKGYGCFNTPVYKEAGVYENDILMTKFWQNDSIVWEQGIKEMHLVIKDNSGGSGHAHKRQDHEKFFPTKVRMTVVQVSANAKYDPSILASVRAAKEESQTASLPAENPFAVASPLPFHAPAFDKAKTEYFLPTFTFGMKQQLAEMNAIASQTEAPTFQNTIEAMERSGAVLTRVDNVFSNLTSAEKTEPLQNIETELAPLRAAHSDNILLNRPLFQRVEKLWQAKATLGLTEEQGEVLKQRYESFVRAGAKLSDQEQGRIRSLNEQLSKLETKFEENLLAIAKERAVVVDTAKELDGLPAAEIAAAAEAAKARGLDGKYLLQISNTTRVPVLTSLNNRALRQRVWEASAYRGLGRNGGIDNRGLVLEIAQLRAERAKVLGYESHAAYKLQNQMAKTPAAARKLLTDLVPGVVERVKQETKDLEAMIKESGESHELAPWDWEYYAEKVRKARYQVDEAAVRPYFELDSVLKNGVFFTMNKLYGISFKERKDLPVYHPDVRVFDVMDRDGSQIGLFYADYFKRDTKRGGAWMSSFVDQSKLLHDKPVIVNCLNIPRPAEGEPALISFDNVTTLFHEMGHALHGLFSDVTYPTVAGTATPRDFVEFPSTFEEDWAIQPEILANYALHYQTKAPIPKDLLDKTIKAKKFNKGFDTLEYLAAALLDLEWHSLNADQIPTDVEVFEAESLKKVGASNPAVPPRYRTAYFAHIWSGGYSSSYYAYLWSESLAADAFAHMMAHGGCTSENGNAFRKEILSRGSSRDPMTSYKAFRGGEPTVDALLIRRGLK